MQKQRKCGPYVILLVLALLCTGGCLSREADMGAPSITAVETEHHIQAQALLLSYAWDDGEDQGAVYGKPAWEREYGAENTLVFTGEGQNRIALSAELPEGASYKIYLPGGEVFDNGIRLPYDSRSSCLYWEEDQSGIGIVAPFTPGEYIYEVTIQWPQDGLQATYGLKVVLEEGEDARWPLGRTGGTAIES